MWFDESTNKIRSLSNHYFTKFGIFGEYLSKVYAIGGRKNAWWVLQKLRYSTPDRVNLFWMQAGNPADLPWMWLCYTWKNSFRLYKRTGNNDCGGISKTGSRCQIWVKSMSQNGILKSLFSCWKVTHVIDQNRYAKLVKQQQITAEQQQHHIWTKRINLELYLIELDVIRKIWHLLYR